MNDYLLIEIVCPIAFARVVGGKHTTTARRMRNTNNGKKTHNNGETNEEYQQRKKNAFSWVIYLVETIRVFAKILPSLTYKRDIP